LSFEPVTGWLVNVQDSTVIDLLNPKTKQQIAPYDHFSARYTANSIRQQVAYAKNAKRQILIATRALPSAPFFCVPQVLASMLMVSTLLLF
jgi:hypothetical protein